MRLTTRDCSRRSARADWQPPHLFSHVERFDFTNRREHLVVRSLPVGPRRFQVVEITSSGHESMTVEFSRTAIVFPTSGVFRCTVGNTKLQAARGDVAMFGPIRRKTTVDPDGTGIYRSLSIILPGSTDHGIYGTHPSSGLADKEWTLRREARASAPLVAFLEYMFADLASDAPALASSRAFAAAEILLSEYLGQLLPGQVLQDIDNTARSKKLVNVAREFMVAHYADPISVPDIAKACDAGVRNLQASFKSVVGLSPRQVLTSIRLERARNVLERAADGASVADAALGAGFFHLGRFSRAYRDAYGELPSETLRKSR